MTMLDVLEHITIIKVYSHQLNKDCSVKHTGEYPRPNLFIVSANQYADNAANQARKVIDDVPSSFETLYYPPFSLRWSFSFEGCVTNK